MSCWYLPTSFLNENIKKRVCIYLLQRYLGQFLEQKLTTNQLTLDLYHGEGSVENVSLDMQALNDMCEKQNLPFELAGGYIGKLAFRVPWSSLLRDSSYVEVHGLRVTMKLKQRVECATSMFESMWSSMTNSLQLAEECLKQDAEITDNSQPLEGIEVFAQAIDSILSRVKVTFINTSFQFEYLPKGAPRGIALVVKVDSIEYTDEAENDPPVSQTTDKNEKNKSYVVSAFTTKVFSLEGIGFATQEISAREQPADVDDYMDPLGNADYQEAPPEAVYPEADLLYFAKIMGRQSIKVRLKQNENIAGPKVSLDMMFGALNIFLSPMQLCDLIELINGLFMSSTETSSNQDKRPSYIEKPMTGLDFQRVEQELQCQLNPGMMMTTALQGTHGWSTAQLDESDADDNFLPMTPRAGGCMGESTLSTASSSMESSLSSSVASCSNSEATSQRSRRKFGNIESDPTAELTVVTVRLASLAIVLLHEDILTVSSEGEYIPLSTKLMTAAAENFFSTLSNLVPPGYGARNFDECKPMFESACSRRHLRLIAAPIQFEGSESRTSSVFSFSGVITSAKLELLECLKKNDGTSEYVRMLHFKDDPSISPIRSKPCLKATFKHHEKLRKCGIRQRVCNPRTDLHIELDSCMIDIDITIVDRLSALFNDSRLKRPTRNVWESQINKTETSSSLVEVKLSSQSMVLKLRIPIPDFRPANDLQRVAWWDRNVRNAFISANLSNVTAHTSLNSNQESQSFDVQCRTLDVYYHENKSAAPLHIAKAGMEDRLSSGMPSLTVTINPVVQPDIVVDDACDGGGIMSMSCGMIIPAVHNGPFSSKRVIHQSDTPHSKVQNEDDAVVMVLPGTKKEMWDFIEKTVQTTRIHLDINLPVASIQFISKHIFEVIYNHILSDLLLWESSAPVSKTKETPMANPPTVETFESFEPCETYASCRSGSKYDSDSDDSDDEFNPESSNIFHSAYETRKQKKQPKVKRKAQNYLTLNLRIGKGLLRMNTPVRDVQSNVIPEQIGEFLLGVEEATIFSVSGYNGDDSLGYVCVQSKDAQLHHSAMLSTSSHDSVLKDIGTALGRHLFPTIFKSESGTLATCANRGGDREMLSVAVRIQANHETHHVKLVRVALGINKATLRHRMCTVPNIWITQLIDFFSVNDYTIPGFQPKDVLTEMHLHLWDCAIDYRPLHIPFRSVVTIGSLSMSSHLTAAANTTTLRFLAEDCNLFLSDRSPPKKGVPSCAPVDLRRDYISIIDVGLIEISLKITDELSGAGPHCDLRASVNKFIIHTCADSARALMELITYIATNGDLADTEADVATCTYQSPKHQVESENTLINVDQQQDISNLSQSEHEQVNEMLVDAMKESIAPPRMQNLPMTGAKLFFFPDEGQQLPDPKSIPQLTSDLGDLTLRSNRSSDTDDEFCFIGDEAGVGIAPKNGLPQIRWLVDDALRLVDNHFTIPVGKTDVLKAPKDFPTPVTRYTLCDMTVQWNLYAGRDFRPTDEREKKTVNFSDVQLHDAIGYTNRNTGEIVYHSSAPKPAPKTACNWMLRGGPERNHHVVLEAELNKVRVMHEVYPEHTKEASRQVIVVTQFEVRDRVRTSRIKKLLYLDASDLRPRQSHANMLTVKLIHIRPDLKLRAQECVLILSLLPLRINLDQDTLLFMLNFATDVINENAKSSLEEMPSKNNTPTHHPPVMTVSKEEVIDDAKAQQLVDENLMLLLDDVKEKVVKAANIEKSTHSTTSLSDNSPPIYFRKIIFTNCVPIRLDYHSNGNFEWKHGPIAALIIGIASLNHVAFSLKRLENNHGILGVDKLVQYFLQEWKNDIRRNQSLSVLGGVGPIHSLVKLFQGVKDLIWLPIEQYQKDGRIVRGLQRGANSFTTSTAMAALELTSRFISLIQITAETAYDMMSPGPSVRRALAIKAKGRKKRYNQPQDIREGVTNAYNVVREGLGETAENIVRVASIEKEQKGFTGAVGGVLRQIPPTIVKPIIIASEATSNVLGGMQCQLVPDARREANEKWKTTDEYMYN